MQVRIQGVGMRVNEQLDELTRTKISKYQRYFDGQTDGSVKYTSSHDLVTCELTLRIGSHYYRSEETDVDARTALDACVDILGRQLRRHKTRFRNHKSKYSYLEASLAAFDEEEATEDEPFESTGEIVRHKEFDVYPMSDEEAVLQMEMLGHSFFVYLSSETEKICVVYSRHDGNYGVLEPQY